PAARKRSRSATITTSISRWSTCSKVGSALSINIFMPLFSICYMSMGANGWLLSQHGRNKIFKVRPDDREALSSKTESKCRESRSIQEIKVGAPANRVVTGSGNQESEQREA